MRLLFLFILLANGLIFSWYHWRVPDEKPTTVLPTAMQLVLLSEAATPIPSQTQQTTGSRCYTLGPLMSDQDLDQASERLTAAGIIEFEKRISEKKEQIGYWVYLPPFASWEAAREVADELKLLGDKHFYVIKPPSEYTHAISLGVFQDKNNANRRYQQIQRFGYEARLAGRFRQNPVYWLDFVQPDNRLTPFTSDRLLSAQLILRDCQRVAQNQPLS